MTDTNTARDMTPEEIMHIVKLMPRGKSQCPLDFEIR